MAGKTGNPERLLRRLGRLGAKQRPGEEEATILKEEVRYCVEGALGEHHYQAAEQILEAFLHSPLCERHECFETYLELVADYNECIWQRNRSILAAPAVSHQEVRAS